MDALDFIINVLKEHEKNLNKLAEKLELTIKKIEGLPKHLETTVGFPVVQCKKWKDFVEKSRGADVVAFEMGERSLTVDSLSRGKIYRYLENLPVYRVQVKKRLECGLEVSVKGMGAGMQLVEFAYASDPEEVKRWLSKKLSIPKKNIIVGKITF